MPAPMTRSKANTQLPGNDSAESKKQTLDESGKDAFRDFARHLLSLSFVELRMLNKLDTPLAREKMDELLERLPKLQRMITTGIPEQLFKSIKE